MPREQLELLRIRAELRWIAVPDSLKRPAEGFVRTITAGERHIQQIYAGCGNNRLCREHHPAPEQIIVYADPVNTAEHLL